jgi:hypothetical protein
MGAHLVELIQFKKSDVIPNSPELARRVRDLLSGGKAGSSALLDTSE